MPLFILNMFRTPPVDNYFYNNTYYLSITGGVLNIFNINSSLFFDINLLHRSILRLIVSNNTIIYIKYVQNASDE